MRVSLNKGKDCDHLSKGKILIFGNVSVGNKFRLHSSLQNKLETALCFGFVAQNTEHSS